MNLSIHPLPTEIEEGTAFEDVIAPRDCDLEALYLRESPRLLRFFRRATQSHHDAEDLTQQTFLQFGKARASHNDEVIGPAAYLSRIAANLLGDRARRAARQRPENHISLDEVSLPATDPTQMLEARDMLERMHRAIAAMKPRTRAIFLAHRIEGLSYREIADRTGMSVKGVEKQMAKAIAQIHRHAGLL